MSETPRTRRSSRRDIGVPVGLMLLGCALVATTTLFAKMLGPAGGGNGLHPLQVSAGRFVFASLALLPLLAWTRPRFRGAQWGNHALRVLLQWAGISCLFAASAAMRLADATAISFLNPIFAMALSIPLLGERVGPWRWAAAAVAFAGAMMLSQPGTDTFEPIALVALLAAVFLGIELVLIKKLADREPPLRILVVNNFLGAGLAAAAASFVWRPPTADQWLILAAIGVVMLSAQAVLLQAMKRGDASFVTPLFYTTLIFAGVYDYLLYDETPTAAGFAGAALIVAGALTIGWRESVQRRRKTAGTQKAAG